MIDARASASARVVAGKAVSYSDSLFGEDPARRLSGAGELDLKRAARVLQLGEEGLHGPGEFRAGQIAQKSQMFSHLIGGARRVAQAPESVLDAADRLG